MGRVLNELGMIAKRTSSGEWKAHCPKHYERTGKIDKHPSWSINETNGKHGCFSCGYKGEIRQLIVDVTDMDMWTALRWLRGLGMETLEVADEPQEMVPDINFLPSLEDEWYLFARPPKKQRLLKHLTVEAIKYYDIRWNDGWCIPITDFKGKWLGYQWKKGKHVLNHPEGIRKGDTLFGVDRFPGGSEGLVIVESPLDVLRLYDCGYDGVATYGAQVTRAQLDLLVSFTDNVIVAMDDDIAGRTSARSIYEQLRYVVPDVRFVDYSGTKKRKDTGKRPKDIGDMTDSEIAMAVDNARYGSEAFTIGLVGNSAVVKKERRVRR